MPALKGNFEAREATVHKPMRANDSIIGTQIQPFVIKTKIN